MEKYTTVKQIGKGNFGVVSVVRSNEDRRYHVMKEINMKGFTQLEVQGAYQEAQLLSKLSHPCIVGYRESILQGDTLFIIMEYCDGGDLSERIRERRAAASAPQTQGLQRRGVSIGPGNPPPSAFFPEEQILDWFTQIALGLENIHSHHILHRDLKTQNVFLTQGGSLVKLGDFGISKVLSSETEFAKTVIGTPYYLSPEICEGKKYGKKSDVWSLGCILYELCTLKHAFDGRTLPALVLKILRGKYPPIARQYSDDLRNLVAWMLQQQPPQRPSIRQILGLDFIRQRIRKFDPKHYSVTGDSAKLQSQATGAASRAGVSAGQQNGIPGGPNQGIHRSSLSVNGGAAPSSSQYSSAGSAVPSSNAPPKPIYLPYQQYAQPPQQGQASVAAQLPSAMEVAMGGADSSEESDEGVGHDSDAPLPGAWAGGPPAVYQPPPRSAYQPALYLQPAVAMTRDGHGQPGAGYRDAYGQPGVYQSHDARDYGTSAPQQAQQGPSPYRAARQPSGPMNPSFIVDGGALSSPRGGAVSSTPMSPPRGPTQPQQGRQPLSARRHHSEDMHERDSRDARNAVEDVPSFAGWQGGGGPSSQAPRAGKTQTPQRPTLREQRVERESNPSTAAGDYSAGLQGGPMSSRGAAPGHARAQSIPTQRSNGGQTARKQGPDPARGEPSSPPPVQHSSLRESMDESRRRASEYKRQRKLKKEMEKALERERIAAHKRGVKNVKSRIGHLIPSKNKSPTEPLPAVDERQAGSERDDEERDGRDAHSDDEDRYEQEDREERDGMHDDEEQRVGDSGGSGHQSAQGGGSVHASSGGHSPCDSDSDDRDSDGPGRNDGVAGRGDGRSSRAGEAEQPSARGSGGERTPTPTKDINNGSRPQSPRKAGAAGNPNNGSSAAAPHLSSPSSSSAGANAGAGAGTPPLSPFSRNPSQQQIHSPRMLQTPRTAAREEKERQSLREFIRQQKLQKQLQNKQGGRAGDGGVAFELVLHEGSRMVSAEPGDDDSEADVDSLPHHSKLNATPSVPGLTVNVSAGPVSGGASAATQTNGTPTRGSRSPSPAASTSSSSAQAMSCSASPQPYPSSSLAHERTASPHASQPVSAAAASRDGSSVYPYPPQFPAQSSHPSQQGASPFSPRTATASAYGPTPRSPPPSSSSATVAASAVPDTAMMHRTVKSGGVRWVIPPGHTVQLRGEGQTSSSASAAASTSGELSGVSTPSPPGPGSPSSALLMLRSASSSSASLPASTSAPALLPGSRSTPNQRVGSPSLSAFPSAYLPSNEITPTVSTYRNNNNSKTVSEHSQTPSVSSSLAPRERGDSALSLASAATSTSSSSSDPERAWSSTGGRTKQIASEREARLAHQIETVRQYCVDVLGSELFQRCYRYVKQVHADSAQMDNNEAMSEEAEAAQAAAEQQVKSWLVGGKQQACLRHIHHLVFCEDLFYSDS